MNRKLTVKQARRLAGLTGIDVAVALGISRNAYWKREKYETDFTYRQACRFADLVGMDKNDIIFFDEDVSSQRDGY